MTDNIITSENIGNHIKYNCNISKSYIIFEINENTLNINNMFFEWEMPKLVLNLINYSINDIIKKNNNLQKFIYCVTIEDYDFLDKTHWNVLNKFGDHYELECDIINAVENILYGFIQ